jgi:hypothetical protein
MRKYLATLHKRPDHHKKRFALLVSGGFTLAIFAVWSMVTLGPNGTLAQDNRQLTTDNQRQNEVSPFESLTSSVASGWQSVVEGLQDLKKSVNGLDFDSDYEEMRSDVIKVYGQ